MLVIAARIAFCVTAPLLHHCPGPCRRNPSPQIPIKQQVKSDEEKRDDGDNLEGLHVAHCSGNQYLVANRISATAEVKIFVMD